MTVSEIFLSPIFSHRFYKLCLSSEGETQRIKREHTDMKMQKKSFISAPQFTLCYYSAIEQHGTVSGGAEEIRKSKLGGSHVTLSVKSHTL